MKRGALVVQFLLLAGCPRPPANDRPEPLSTATATASTSVVPPPEGGPAPTVATAPTPSASAVPVDDSGVCPDDMVEVKGDYCTELELKCLRKRKRRQCAEYAVPTKCTGDEVPMHYCMERFEHPNEKGALPQVMTKYTEAKASCEARGRRLCTEAEWTLACEGPERTPYPYGYTRDATACPIDKPSPLVNERRLFNARTQKAELERLDQRDPSGTYARCRSAYGVYDLTGSVDEWVTNPSGKPYVSSLKGGNWGEYRNACRPVTRGHGPGFFYYQIGFRCCLDAPSP